MSRRKKDIKYGEDSATIRRDARRDPSAISETPRHRKSRQCAHRFGPWGTPTAKSFSAYYMRNVPPRTLPVSLRRTVWGYSWLYGRILTDSEIYYYEQRRVCIHCGKARTRKTPYEFSIRAAEEADRFSRLNVWRRLHGPVRAEQLWAKHWADDEIEGWT